MNDTGKQYLIDVVIKSNGFHTLSNPKINAVASAGVMINPTTQRNKTLYP